MTSTTSKTILIACLVIALIVAGSIITKPNRGTHSTTIDKAPEQRTHTSKTVTQDPPVPKKVNAITTSGEIEIESNDARRITGRVISLDEQSIKFQRTDGQIFDIPKSTISAESLRLVYSNWLYWVNKGEIKAPIFASKPVHYLFDTFEHLGMSTKGWMSRGDTGRYSAVFDTFRYNSGHERLQFYFSGKKNLVTDIQLIMSVDGAYEAGYFALEHYIEMCERLYRASVGSDLPAKAKEAIKNQDNMSFNIPGASVYVISKSYVRGVGLTRSIWIRLPTSSVELTL